MRMLAFALISCCLAGAAAAQTGPSPAPCSGPEYRQLDFWAGDWDAEFDGGNGQIGHASNRITKDEYGACAISEHFVQPGGAAGGGDYIGGSYSMYDPVTKQWRQMWVDNGGAPFVLVGGPVSDQPHVFELRTTEPRGKGKIMRMIWQDVTPATFTWRWQSQEADGAWKDAWMIRYRRKGAS